jgi:arylamine N-acetyltransferase
MSTSTSIYFPAYAPEECLLYLQRLSLSTSPDTGHAYTASSLPHPTAALLYEIHRQHLLSIPFSCLGIHFDPTNLPPREAPIPYRSTPGPSVDHALCFTKIVTQRAGGYCFENNTALAALLRGLGYQVHLRLARANFAARGDVKVNPEWTALAHCVIVATPPGDSQSYFADVGFGGGGLLEPLPLQDGAAETHKLDPSTQFDLRRGRLPGPDIPADDMEIGWTLYKQGPETNNLRLPIVHIHDAFVHYPHDLRQQNIAVMSDVDNCYVARTGVILRLRPEGGTKVMLLNRVKEEGGDWVLKGTHYVKWSNGKKESEENVENVGKMEDVLRQEFGLLVGRKA